MVLASPSVVPAARGLLPLTGKLAAGHCAGDDGNSGRPGCRRARGWVPDGRDASRGAWRPRALRGRGRTPAPDHPAGIGLRSVAVERSCALLVARCRRVRLPGAPHPCHAERYGRSERTLAEPPFGTPSRSCLTVHAAPRIGHSAPGIWVLGSLIEGLAHGHGGGACAHPAGPLATASGGADAGCRAPGRSLPREVSGQRAGTGDHSHRRRRRARPVAVLHGQVQCAGRSGRC